MADPLHPAIIACRALYDLERDNTPLERFFMSRVGEIVWRTGQTRSSAIQMFGVNSGAYVASCNLAQRQQDHDLTAALESYQRHLEPCP